jgi:hypothetical protein
MLGSLTIPTKSAASSRVRVPETMTVTIPVRRPADGENSPPGGRRRFTIFPFQRGVESHHEASGCDCACRRLLRSARLRAARRFSWRLFRFSRRGSGRGSSWRLFRGPCRLWGDVPPTVVPWRFCTCCSRRPSPVQWRSQWPARIQSAASPGSSSREIQRAGTRAIESPSTVRFTSHAVPGARRNSFCARHSRPSPIERRNIAPHALPLSP